MLLKRVTFREADGETPSKAAANTKGTDTVVVREGWLLQINDLTAKSDAFEAIPDRGAA